jgi:hypothetical protein
MFIRSVVAIAVAIAGSFVSHAAHAQYGGRGNVVVCESFERRDNYCAVDTRRGVQLLRALSRTPCTLGQTWGYDRGGIWVTAGCRGEFEIGHYGGGGYGWGWGYEGGDYVVCASRDYRHQFCPANIRGTVVIVNQISRSPCIEGRSWGYDRRGIWVDQGCSGEFQVVRGRGDGYPGGGYRRDDDHYGGGYAQTITCESRDNRRRYCRADLRYNAVRVIDNLSRVRCDQGYNWDFDDGGIWVTDGCRAVFGVEPARGYGGR